ncbi:MAG: superinfection immunity protein [Parashewanella sp.]
MKFIEVLKDSGNLSFILFGSIAVLFGWFLPALLALFFNRKDFKIILAACIPAGFSFLAWGALLVWATNGERAKRYLSKFIDLKMKN